MAIKATALATAVGGVSLLAVGVGIAWWLRPAAPRGVTAVRITANPADLPVTGAVVSPDGKYVAYSDPTGVYVRHIDSGETRPRALPKGFNGIPTSWFPDSMHLLLSNHEGPQQTAKIWEASILGGNPQNAAGGRRSGGRIAGWIAHCVLSCSRVRTRTLACRCRWPKSASHDGGADRNVADDNGCLVGVLVAGRTTTTEARPAAS